MHIAPAPSLGGRPHVPRARTTPGGGAAPVVPAPGRTAAGRAGAGSAAGRPEARHVLHRAARVLLRRLPDLTDRVALAIQRQEPAYRPPATDPEELWQEVYRSLRYSVASLLRPGENRRAARRCTRRIAARRAESGLPLDALLHAFRIGGGVVWDELLTTAGRLDPEGMRLLVHVASEVWNFVDEHCSLAAEAHRGAQRRLAWRRHNQRRLMLQGLLDGTSRVAELPEIAATLGLAEDGRYAVVVVRAAAPRPPAGPAAPERDTRWSVSRVTPPPGLRLLWHAPEAQAPDAGPHGGGAGGTATALVVFDDQAGGGAGDHAAGRGSADDADTLLADLARALTPPPPWRVGVSSVVTGLAAVGEARRLAVTALRAAGGGGRVARLDDHLPAALLVSSPELGAALADRVLGPVLRLAGGDRRLLLDTLTAWLACDGSAQRAGARLGCHRNTVLNRLRRYEKLTGCSLHSPRRLAELSLALTAHQLRACSRHSVPLG